MRLACVRPFPEKTAEGEVWWCRQASASNGISRQYDSSSNSSEGMRYWRASCTHNFILQKHCSWSSYSTFCSSMKFYLRWPFWRSILRFLFPCLEIFTDKHMVTLHWGSVEVDNRENRNRLMKLPESIPFTVILTSPPHFSSPLSFLQ